jgi:predicted RND superfamily exporter protein
MSAFKLAFYIVIAFFIIFFLMLIFFENFTMGLLEVIGVLVELLWAFLCLLFWGGLLVLVVALMIAFYRME